jgi:hypothetical protein
MTAAADLLCGLDGASVMSDEDLAEIGVYTPACTLHDRKNSFGGIILPIIQINLRQFQLDSGLTTNSALCCSRRRLK